MEDINYNLISQLKVDDNTTDFFLFRFNNNDNQIEIDLFNNLKEIANNTSTCFNYLAPYKEATLRKNTEYFILYHMPSNKVFGWTNVILSVNHNTDLNKYTYTLKIDKIVIISNFGELKNIGTFMINYILKLYENPCKIFNSYKTLYELKIVDYIYLYSLNPTIPFYNRLNGLISLNELKLTDEIPFKKNIFIKIPKITEKKQLFVKKINISMNDLHTFEADEIDISSDSLIQTNIKPKCRDKNNSILPKIKENIKKQIMELIITNEIIFENIDKKTRKTRKTTKRPIKTTRSLIRKNA